MSPSRSDDDVRRREALHHARFDRASAAADPCARSTSGAALRRMTAIFREIHDGTRTFVFITRTTLEDAVLLVDGANRSRLSRNALGRPQEQVAAGLQSVVEHRQHVVLQLGVEVDEQIAAGHEVHARERRIADDAVRGEDAQVANLLGQHVGRRLPARKKRFSRSSETMLAASHADSGRCARRPAPAHRCRSQTPAPSAATSASHVLAQQDRDRIGLLAGRASGHPHAHGVARRRSSSNSFGMTLAASASNASASRKKLVTPISRSRNSRLASSPSWRSRSA